MNTTKMGDETINQNDIVQKYLHNKLTPEETVEFEEYIMDKPHLLEQLELDSVMVEHLPSVQEIPVQSRLFSSIFKTIAFAAPVLCCVVLLLILFNEPSTMYTANNNSHIHYLENLRSVNKKITENITVERNTRSLMIVATPYVLAEQHQVSLINPLTSELIYSDVKKLSELGQLNVLVNGNVIDLGLVKLRVEPIYENQALENSSIEVELVIKRQN
ncbi:hypothetical protein [Paraglaciecola sp.]|uniref:hypothetical protein n=1 Tax=Paraglaciecola sp. TaxID=1920173 RepID=UPI003264BCA2